MTPDFALFVARTFVGMCMIQIVLQFWPRFIYWLNDQGLRDVATIMWFAPWAYVVACFFWPMVMLYPFVAAAFLLQDLILWSWTTFHHD